MEIQGEEKALFEKFVEACRPILAAGFEHARQQEPEAHAGVLAAIGENFAVPRLCVTWDDLYVVINVDAAGITSDGKPISMPVFGYRLSRQAPPGTH